MDICHAIFLLVAISHVSGRLALSRYQEIEFPWYVLHCHDRSIFCEYADKNKIAAKNVRNDLIFNMRINFAFANLVKVDRSQNPDF